MLKNLLTGLSLAGVLLGLPASAQSIVEHIDDPVVLSLPNGFAPDGITIANDGTIYVASFYDGTIVRGSVDGTQITDVLVQGQEGRPGWGMDLDDAEAHLFVAGGFAGTARVYDAQTGALSAEITLTDAGIVNDVIVTNGAAYFTNSSLPEVYELTLDDGSVVGEPRTIPLTGDFQFDAEYFANGNGIVAARDGTLIVNHSFLGKIYAIDIANGAATEISLGGETVSSDGIALDGKTLIGTEPPMNQVAEMVLSDDLSEARVRRRFTADILDFPSLVAMDPQAIYVVNGRLTTERDQDVSYEIVRFKR